MKPEEKARVVIDRKLREAGWVIQDLKEFNIRAAKGVIVREYPTDSGPADYLLYLNREPVGVIEAKKEELGETLHVVEEQTLRYACSPKKWRIDNGPLRFGFESTNELTMFTDFKDKKPRARRIFSFPSPERLEALLKEGDTLRNRMKVLPALNEEGLRECQVKAIKGLESSFSENKPRALIQMATGSGKTFTAITSVYRLLKHAGANRVLFLVDTKNLGEQAEGEFRHYTPHDDSRNFDKLYNVQRLQSSYISGDSQVCISTIQRLYSILKGEPLDESDEDDDILTSNKDDNRPKEVIYNADYPPEFFDFIIIDECHRSIYNTWMQVLEYFDAFLIGLTATPEKRTFGFFDENLVSEYTYEQAVADGVNVDYDVYEIETNITKNGAVIPAKQYVNKRHKMSRKQRWQQLDEPVIYEGGHLDRAVVNPSQIRQVIREFKNKITTEIFPGREEIPKTIIFAKSDSHCDDIIRAVRDEFGEENRFCKKITYKDGKAKESIKAFRTEYYPRIAVTVNMIATGTDIKAVECLLFMRSVSTRSYFEQMKGRGCRTLIKDDLIKVTPSASSNKTHFVIVDAVGVYDRVKTESRVLESRPKTSFKDLMNQIANENREEEVFTSLGKRLSRLDKKLEVEEKEMFAELTGGKTLGDVVNALFNCFNDDLIDERARERFNLQGRKMVAEEQFKITQDEMLEETAAYFYEPEIRNYLEELRKKHEQIIDHYNIDQVINSGWKQENKEKAEDVIKSFKQFIKDNREEIGLLKIYYNQNYRKERVTLKMIKELCKKLEEPAYNLPVERIWNAYFSVMPEKVKQNNLKRREIDIISCIRFELGIDKKLFPYSDIVSLNFKNWVFKKNAGHIHYSEEQMEWLRMIKDTIASSMSVDKESFDISPFDVKGGLAKLYHLFGKEYEAIIEELNSELVA